MQNEFIEQVTSAGKTSYEAMQELGAINANAIQKLTELQFNLASLNLESGVEQAKLLSTTTNYKDLLSAESDLAGDYSTKAMDITRQAAEVLTKSRDEIVSWFEKGVENTGKAVKPAAKKPARKSTASTAANN